MLFQGGVSNLFVFSLFMRCFLEMVWLSTCLLTLIWSQHSFLHKVRVLFFFNIIESLLLLVNLSKIGFFFILMVTSYPVQSA